MTATTDGKETGRVPSVSRTIDELDKAIGRLNCRINAASYELLLLVREFDDRLGWAKWSFGSCSEWLAWRCGITLSAAREKVRTAQALRALPKTSEAFATGRLSYSKARALTRVASSRDEDLLLAYALDVSAAQVEQRCRQMRNAQPESTAEAEQAFARRTLYVSRNLARGTLTLTVELPADVGELVVKAIEHAVETGENAPGPSFETTSWHAQQVDGLVAIARAYLADGEARPTSTADHYQVVVHVDESALRGGIGRSDLPLETVKRLSCDGSLIRIVENTRGEPLDVGRKSRTVPTAIRRALWARDGGCAFPGCPNTHFVDAHHLQHWIDGGETSVDNTLLLCTHHHRLIHQGAFRIRRDEAGERYFERRDGRVIPQGGYRIDDALPDPIHLGDTSAEGWLQSIVRRPKPTAEVREQQGFTRGHTSRLRACN